MPTYNWVCHVCGAVNQAGTDKCLHCNAPSELSGKEIAILQGVDKAPEIYLPRLNKLFLLYGALAVLSFLFFVGSGLAAVFTVRPLGTVIHYSGLILLPVVAAWFAITWAKASVSPACLVGLMVPVMYVVGNELIVYYLYQQACATCLSGGACPKFPPELTCNQFPAGLIFLRQFFNIAIYAELTLAVAAACLGVFLARKRNASAPTNS